MVWGWLCRPLRVSVCRTALGCTLGGLGQPGGCWPGHSCAHSSQSRQLPAADRKGAVPCSGILCLELTEVQIKSSLKDGGGFTAGKGRELQRQ